MARHTARIRANPRRKGTRASPPEPDRVSAPAEAEVTSLPFTPEQIALSAQLHDHAVETVTTTIGRMQQRTQQAAQANPELAPLLDAYYDAARASLIANTRAILTDTTLVRTAEPVRPQPRRPWRFSFPRLIPGRTREEQGNG